MAKIKLATVRVNAKEKIVQIKMNRGSNHTLKGEAATTFIARRDELVKENQTISASDVLAAREYLEAL